MFLQLLWGHPARPEVCCSLLHFQPCLLSPHHLSSLSLAVLWHYSSKKSCYTQEPAVNAKQRLLPVLFFLFSDSSCLVHLKSSRGHPGDSNAYNWCCSLSMVTSLLPFLFLPTGIVQHWGRLFLKGSFNVRLEKQKISIQKAPSLKEKEHFSFRKED